VFRNREVSLDSLLASACLPAIHRAVEIDGEAYWDGGLTANPPIFPLLHLCSARDIMVLLLHPCRRPTIPTTTEEIGHRLQRNQFQFSLFTNWADWRWPSAKPKAPCFLSARWSVA